MRPLLAMLLILSLNTQISAQTAHIKKVRALVARLGQPIRAGEAQPDLSVLDRRAIPEMIRLLGKIESPGAFKFIAKRLYELGAVQSIPVLLNSYRRPLQRTAMDHHHPSDEIVYLWGYRAIGPALSGLRSNSYRVRYGSAKLLVSRAPFVPMDRRLFPAFKQMANSEDRGMRLLAVQALSQAAIDPQVDRNGEGFRAFEVKSMPAILELSQMTVDSDHEIRHRAASSINSLIWSRSSSQAEGMDILRKSNGYLDPYTVSHDLPRIRAFLKNKDAGLRVVAVALLSYGSAPEVSALTDPSPEVRQIGELVLSRQHLLSVDQVTPLLNNPSAETRAAASRVLGWTFSRDALPALRKALHDSDRKVRDSARRAIDRIEGRALR